MRQCIRRFDISDIVCHSSQTLFCLHEFDFESFSFCYSAFVLSPSSPGHFQARVLTAVGGLLQLCKEGGGANDGL